MSTPYNNNIRGLGDRYDSTNPYMLPGTDPRFMQEATGLGNITPAPKIPEIRSPEINTHAPALAQNKAIPKEKGFFESIGDYYKKSKEAVFGTTPGTSLTKDALGNFDTSVMDLDQWQKFGENGGYVDADGKLFNKDGSAFKLGNEEKGLGSIFDSETMKTVGDAAKTGTAVLGLYTGLDNLFGAGAKDRRESKRMMKQSFEQNYAMNDMAMKKFKEDNSRFKADRERITSSYMS